MKNLKRIVIFGILVILSVHFSNLFAVGLKFKAKDIENKPISDSVFADSKLTMINIWGTFCGPCIMEMPDLGELSRKYDKKDFQLMGIVIDAVNRKGDPDQKMIKTANQIVEKTGANYLHVVPSKELLYGVLSEVYAVPTTFFVDKDGNLVGNVYTGSRPLAAWQAIVEEILEEIK